MATEFDVDVQALRALSRDLEQAVHSMAAARGQLGAASQGQTGDGSLDRACGEFQDKWGYGLQQLEKTAGAFVEGLNQTVKAYQAVEDEIQKSFGGGGHGTLTPIGHGPRIEPGPVHGPVHEPVGAPPINQPVGTIPTPILRTEPTPEPVGYIPPPTIHFEPTPVPAPRPGGASQ